jgi:polysaccharide export outer membrane protein
LKHLVLKSAAFISTLALAVACAVAVHAQDSPLVPQSSAPPGNPTSGLRLLISPGDEAELAVYGAPDMSQKLLVTSGGDVQVPLLGPVHVAGLTAEEAQTEIARQLAEKHLLSNPQVTLVIKEYTGQRVSITGEVNKPGSYPIVQARRLVDLILEAGGTTSRAGKTVTIVHADSPGTPLVVTLGNDLFSSVTANMQLQPGDIVTVGRGGVVYVIGEVNKPGAFVLENNQNVTVLQALAMAAGPTRVASLRGARILHQEGSGVKTTNIDLAHLLKAQNSDIALRSDDILWVPGSKGKLAVDKGASSILGMITSLAVYKF